MGALDRLSAKANEVQKDTKVNVTPKKEEVTPKAVSTPVKTETKASKPAKPEKKIEQPAKVKKTSEKPQTETKLTSSFTERLDKKTNEKGIARTIYFTKDNYELIDSIAKKYNQKFGTVLNEILNDVRESIEL